MAIRESFLHKIWGYGVLWSSTSEQSAKVFSTKTVFSSIREGFLPRKFPAIQYIPKIQLTFVEGCDITKFCLPPLFQVSPDDHPVKHDRGKHGIVKQKLALFPGSRVWQVKCDPGTHCLCMLSSFLEISEKF